MTYCDLTVVWFLIETCLGLLGFEYLLVVMTKSYLYLKVLSTPCEAPSKEILDEFYATGS